MMRKAKYIVKFLYLYKCVENFMKKHLGIKPEFLLVFLPEVIRLWLLFQNVSNMLLFASKYNAFLQTDLRAVHDCLGIFSTSNITKI